MSFKICAKPKKSVPEGDFSCAAIDDELKTAGACRLRATNVPNAALGAGTEDKQRAFAG